MRRIVRSGRVQIKRLYILGRAISVAAVFSGLFRLGDWRGRKAGKHEQNRCEYRVLIFHKLSFLSLLAFPFTKGFGERVLHGKFDFRSDSRCPDGYRCPRERNWDLGSEEIRDMSRNRERSRDYGTISHTTSM